eukprot:TRINITY_DN9461_c0_g1_i1.p4 TRINITY_DN9461_c0_g1~~TRINITY_DN9461_c0_g1_i1.p4  ORF type:complete len:105 (+),score=14.40 TRINITY_DN9461_c0_g1_i1:958-1272(+)
MSPPQSKAAQNCCAGLEFGFDIVTSDRTYLLQADTEHDREMWVNSVAAVLANRDIRRTPSSRGAQEVRTLSEALDDITYNHRWDSNSTSQLRGVKHLDMSKSAD